MMSWRSIMGAESAEQYPAQNPQNEQKPVETNVFADIADIANGDVSNKAVIQQAFKEGKPIRVWSGVLHEWIWFAPSIEIAKRKKQQTSEVVYHRGEIIIVKGWNKQDLKNIHALKKSFDGEIIE